jgi:SAM-dependent methyltransferase
MSTLIVNTEQAAAWDGHEGEVWTEHADRYERAGRRILQRLLGAEVIGASDRVLDVGCGTGGLTRAAARKAVEGHATGIDLSTSMLDLARKRSADEGLTNVTFLRGDAQVHPFDAGAFDVVVSSFGAMFFGDPVTAFGNIGAALRPGARLALLAWRRLDENVWLSELRAALALGRDLPVPPPEAPTPFSLADPHRVRRVLTAAGLADVELEPLDEPMDLGSDAADALEFSKSMGIVEGLTQYHDEASVEQAFANLAELFARHETADGVLIPSAAWLIRARKP